MKFKFINTLASAKAYVEAVEKDSSNFDKLWEENMIKPYWSKISEWAHNWFVLRGDAKGDLLEYLINEGQADAFACSLYSSLEPKWLSPLTSSKAEKLWGKYSLVLNSTDRSVQEKYMFGDKYLGIPWCAGYYFGYQIIKSFLKNNPDIGFDKLIDMDSDEILFGSDYASGQP